MVVSEHSTTLKGIVYQTKTLPASEGLDLLPRIASLAGEDILSLLVGTEDGEVTLLLDDPKVIGAIMLRVAERAAGKTGRLSLSQIAQDICRYMHADKVRIGDTEVPGSVHTHFDTHFAGRYAHLLEVCTWGLRVSFGVP